MEKPEVRQRFIVAGRVQGVFFRESTRQVAEPLGLRGHAVNLPDGTVDVVAVGSEEAVAELAQWLEHGPALARVDSVTPAEAPVQEFETFTTG